VVPFAASTRFAGTQSYALTVGFSPQLGLSWKLFLFENKKLTTAHRRF